MTRYSVFMLGFAVINAPTPTTTRLNPPWAIWLVSRLGVGSLQVECTNAVTLISADPERGRKLRALVADRIVVATPGTAIPGVMTLDDTRVMEEQARSLYREIVARTRTSIDFPPITAYVTPEGDDMAAHALALARYVRSVWSAWLFVEHLRIQRLDKMPDNLQMDERDIPSVLVDIFAQRNNIEH